MNCRCLSGLAALALFAGCSSVGVYDLQKHGQPVSQAPAQILVQPFSAQLSAFHLGQRPPQELRALREEIVRDLAQSTAAQLRIHAADSAVVTDRNQIVVGTWLIRGEIRRVHQGSRALRATVGLGAGRTEMRTRVTVYRVDAEGLSPILTFNTTGSSGLEPGAAVGAATGGASLIGTSAAVLGGSLAGVSTDVERTAYETAAVLSAYLRRNGLHDPSRRAVEPNMRGQAPSTVNTRRAMPAPLRGDN